MVSVLWLVILGMMFYGIEKFFPEKKFFPHQDPYRIYLYGI